MDRGSSPTAAFFERLGQRGHETLLEQVTGTIRFDLRDEDGVGHWWVSIEHGDVHVSQENRPADCVLHADRSVFDQLVTGELHQLPAWLRHMFTVEGQGFLFRVFANAFPGPPGAHDPRDLVPYARRRR